MENYLCCMWVDTLVSCGRRTCLQPQQSSRNRKLSPQLGGWKQQKKVTGKAHTASPMIYSKHQIQSGNLILWSVCFVSFCFSQMVPGKHLKFQPQRDMIWRQLETFTGIWGSKKHSEFQVSLLFAKSIDKSLKMLTGRWLYTTFHSNLNQFSQWKPEFFPSFVNILRTLLSYICKNIP